MSFIEVDAERWYAMERNIAQWKVEELDWKGTEERLNIKLKDAQRWAYQMRDDLRDGLLAKRGWKRKMAMRMLRLRIENDKLRRRQDDLWRWHDEAQAEKMHSMAMEQEIRRLRALLEARSGPDEAAP